MTHREDDVDLMKDLPDQELEELEQNLAEDID